MPTTEYIETKQNTGIDHSVVSAPGKFALPACKNMRQLYLYTVYHKIYDKCATMTNTYSITTLS